MSDFPGVKRPDYGLNPGCGQLPQDAPHAANAGEWDDMPETTPGQLSVATPEGDQPPVVEFDHVTFAFDEHVILRDVSFSIPTGTMTIIFGESGVGKSVTLKLILGLLCVDEGTIHVNGVRIDNMPEPELIRVRGNIGMVFQSYAIWPHMTVGENISYPLRVRKMSRKDIATQVSRVLELVGLGGLEKRPAPMLSGGQQQRVALARAVSEACVSLERNIFLNG